MLLLNYRLNQTTTYRMIDLIPTNLLYTTTWDQDQCIRRAMRINSLSSKGMLFIEAMIVTSIAHLLRPL